MARNLSSAVVILTILCLSLVLKADEDNLASKYGESYKDSDKLVSPSAEFNNPSSEQVLRPSEWSKEINRYLEPNDNKNIWNEDQGISFFGMDFNKWDLKKFFQYVENLLYDANQKVNDSLNKSSNDVKTEIQNETNKNFMDKSENGVKDEEHNHEKSYTLHKSDNGEMENSVTKDALNSQNFTNNHSSDNKQETENELQNSTDEDSTDNSRYGTKTESRSSENTGLLNRSREDEEMQNSRTNNTSNTSPYDEEKRKKFLNNEPLNDKEAIDDSKIKLQNSVDEDYINNSENSRKTAPHNSENTKSLNNVIDDEETPNPTNSDKSNKSSRDGEEQISSDDKSQNIKPLTKKCKTKIKNSENNSDIEAKDKIQNPTEAEYINELSNDENRNSLNNESLNNRQQFENSKNLFQNSSNKDYSNISTDNEEAQNLSHNDIQLESKYDEPGKDIKADTTNNYEDLNMDDVISKDATTKNMQETEANAYDAYNDTENEDEDDADEDDKIENKDKNYTDKHNMNENESDDFYLVNYENENEDDRNEDKKIENEDENYTDTYNMNEKEVDDFYLVNYEYDNEDEENESENNVEDDNIQKNENNADENKMEDGYIQRNKNDTDENRVEDDYINKNISNSIENSNRSQKSELATTVDTEKNNSTTTAPKFTNKSTTEQQNYFETQPLRNETKNSDNVISEAAEPESITDKENTFPKFEVTSGEFIDDYINNPRSKIPKSRIKPSNKSEEFIPNRNDKTTATQIPISENHLNEDSKSLTAFSPLNKSTNGQNLPFDQSQNDKSNIGFGKDSPPFPNYNENIRDISNQTVLNENSPQYIQNTFVSDDQPSPYAQEDKTINEVPSLNLDQFQQTQYYTDFSPSVPQNGYNAFTEPAILNFQNNHPSIESFHNSAPETDIYKPEEINSFQLFSNKNPNFQISENVNNQDSKTPNGIVEQKQPTFIQRDTFPNIQYIPNNDIPNSQNEPRYFTNYMPEIPLNAPSSEKPMPNREMLSNFVILNNLQFNPKFDQMYNQESLPTDIESNLMNAESQYQLNAMTPQNQINETEILNMQNQPDNVLFQDNLSGYNTFYPQNDTEKALLQNETKNIPIPYEDKMISKVVPENERVKSVEFLVPQNDTGTSNGLPHDSFTDLEYKPNKKTFFAVIPEKPIVSQTKNTSDEPLNDESQKSIQFNKLENFEEEESKYDYEFSESNSYDESSNYDYNKEYDDDADDDDGDGDDDDDDNSDDSDDDDDDDGDGNDDDDDDETEQTTTIPAKTITDAPDGDELEQTTTILTEAITVGDESEQTTTIPTETITVATVGDQSEQATTIPTETINDGTSQITQESSLVESNSITVSPAAFETQNEVVPPNQEEKFNTILEFIYKFSNNSLFQNLRD